MRELTRIVLHHSASAGGSVIQFREDHMAKGWTDVGYHVIICNGNGGGDGQRQRGRPDFIAGAGVRENNTGALHVCCVGNFHKPDKGFTGKPTLKQMRALGYQLVDWANEYPKANLALTDHRTDALAKFPTACPGSEFPTALIKEWFAGVKAKIAGTSPASVSNLDDYLKSRGYWVIDRPVSTQSPDAVETKTLANANPIEVEVHLIGEGAVNVVTGIIMGGRTWVELGQVAKSAGWRPPVQILQDGVRFVRQICKP